MERSKHITIMLVPDGAEARYGWKVRRWVLYSVLAVLGLVILGIFLFFISYGKMVSKAAMADKLKAENEDLQRYKYKVSLLEANLMQARDMVSRLTKLAGIEYQFPDIPDDSTLLKSVDMPGAGVLARPAGKDWALPEGLPVQGFTSQDFDTTNHDTYHPGVDIAVAIGTPVLATGSGEVIFAGPDSIYGNEVIIRHNDTLTTLYAHNDRLLVKKGQKVQVGSRIALSGNTGKSTAPHVHYEVRANDKPINPVDNQYDQENIQQ
jgi:murein DD-endopeptidase MepM/ murein hydrolase activator NlpD